MPLLEFAEKRGCITGPTSTEPALQSLWEVLGQIRQRESGSVVESIPWITLKHPIHPVQRQFLDGIDCSFARPPGKIRCFFRFSRSLLKALLLTFRLARIRLGCWPVLRRVRGRRFDVAAKTWVFTGVPTPDNDFYYGDLGHRLFQRGLRLLLLASDPRGWDRPVSVFLNDSGAQIPEWCLVPIRAPFQTVLTQWRVSGRLLRWARTLPKGLLQRAAFQAGWDALSHGVTSKALYPWVGKETARLWDLKTIMTLYEGHGWERCFLQAAAKENPRCRTVGYQHTVLMPYQLELLRPLLEGPPTRPQAVLCLGERTRELLRQGHPSSELLAFGSFRNAASRKPADSPAVGKTVLVLPEGFREESIRLFGCALEAAAASPGYRFILRCHPVLPFEEIRRELAWDPETVPNVEVSSGRSMEEDFSRSSAVLYRGSSSVLYGILHGLKAVYLEGGPCIDPLFELPSWRERVISAQELVRVLNGDQETLPQERSASWKEAAAYIQRYAFPVREGAVEEFCRWIESTRGPR